MRCFLLMAVVGLFFSRGEAVRADDASFGGDGATVFALKENRIRMVSEHIVIHRADGGRWRAECDFTFENKSPRPAEIQMGFPDWKISGELDGAWAIESFAVTVPGKKITVSHRSASKGLPEINRLEYEGAFVWPMSFKPKQTVTVHNSYLFRGLSSNGPLNGCLGRIDAAHVRDVFWRKVAKVPGGWDYEDSLCQVVSYIVSTARTWNGSIGEATIEIELDPKYSPHAVVFVPFAGEVSGGWARWRFKDWNPSSDIFVIYLHPPMPDSAKDATPLFDTVAQARAWMNYARLNHFDAATIAKVRAVMPESAKAIRAALTAP